MQRELKGRRLVFWPVNMDEAASIKDGRKIPRQDAVRHPKVEEILEAAERLGLNPEVEDASYPRRWWDQQVRIVVDKRWSKRETLRRISLEVKRARAKHR